MCARAGDGEGEGGGDARCSAQGDEGDAGACGGVRTLRYPPWS